MARKAKGGAGWLWGAVLLVALGLAGWQLERYLGQSAHDRYKTLTAAAEASLARSEFDSAARYALAAIQGHNLPLIGFDDRQAEDVLALAVGHATRGSLGKPVRTLQLPPFHSQIRYVDSPPQTVWLSATNNRAVLLSGDDAHKVYSQWDVGTGAMIGAPYDLPKDTAFIGTSDDNRYAIVARDGFYLYDLERRTLLPQHTSLLTTWSSTPVYSSAYKVMITQPDDFSGFAVWDFSKEMPTQQIVAMQFEGFRLSADGRSLVLYKSLNELAVWDIATRTFLPPSSLEAFKARGLGILGGKAVFDLEAPGNDTKGLSPEAAARMPGAPVVLTNAPYSYGSYQFADDRPFYSDGTSISIVRYDHVLTTWRIDPALALRGPELIALACAKPALRRFTPQDIAAVPSLGSRRDVKICP